MRKFLIAGMLLLAPGGAFAQDLEGRDPGLYAYFETSQGDFLARLYQAEVPKIVGNFVNLATGRQQWRDPENGEVMVDTPFYGGVIFHRVMNGFMIQTGDRTGTGLAGPGYTIPDEFGEGLRHGREGILSMANRGPDSNGSQFFVLLGPQRHLDGVHSIFGEVVDGMSVVRGIGRVPVDKATEKPIRDVVLEKVTIHQIDP